MRHFRAIAQDLAALTTASSFSPFLRRLPLLLPLPVLTNQWHRHPFNNRKEGRERFSPQKRAVDSGHIANRLLPPKSSSLSFHPPFLPSSAISAGGGLAWRMPPPSPTPSSANGYFRISPSCLLLSPPLSSALQTNASFPFEAETQKEKSRKGRRETSLTINTVLRMESK